MADVSGIAATQIEGSVAHDSPNAGNPVVIGAEARTSFPTAVASGDIARLICDDTGRLVVSPFAMRDKIIQDRLVLTGTSETTLISAVASQFNDVLFLSMSNSGSADTLVDIRDSTGGTIRLSIFLPQAGGGAIIPFPVPLGQLTSNNNWTAQLSVASTSVYITSIAMGLNI
jgi:hypothetical protein